MPESTRKTNSFGKYSSGPTAGYFSEKNHNMFIPANHAAIEASGPGAQTRTAIAVAKPKDAVWPLRLQIPLALAQLPVPYFQAISARSRSRAAQSILVSVGLNLA